MDKIINPLDAKLHISKYPKDYPDCCIGCEYAYKNEEFQIDCACTNEVPDNCYMSVDRRT